MEDKFDRLTKAMAGGISRRVMLRVTGGGILGALFGSLGAGRVFADNQTSACNHYCDQFRHPQKQACKDACRACAGGPSQMCGLVCCPEGQVCVNGICTIVGNCPPGTTQCGDTCCNANEDCVDISGGGVCLPRPCPPGTLPCGATPTQFCCPTETTFCSEPTPGVFLCAPLPVEASPIPVV